MNSIDLAAERAASRARREQREREWDKDLSPWMRYVWFLFDKYPSNPVSYLYLDCFSAPGTSQVRRSMSDGEPGGDREGGDDYSESRGMVTDTVLQNLKGYDSSIDRAAHDVQEFLHRLPEEDTYEAWLATQED